MDCGSQGHYAGWFKYNKVKTNVVTMEVLDKGFDDWMHGNVHHIR